MTVLLRRTPSATNSWLDLSAHIAADALDLARRGVESLPDRDQCILSLGSFVVIPVDNDIPMSGHRDAKLDIEKLSAPVTGLRPIDDDATTGNSRTEFSETLHLRSDLRSDLLRWLAIPIGDF